MKILKGEFHNFGSYNKLEFDFSDLGLALVFGKTGSGKSTLPDLVAWSLFGQTAKDGSVDDVRNWTKPGEPTIGVLHVLTNDGSICMVTRERGGKSDLFWTEITQGSVHSTPIRGKDITETQKLLEERLGVSAELFFMGVYFHEFSNTGLFFTASAKDRRDTFERLASLRLAIRLCDTTRNSRKQSRSVLESNSGSLRENEGKLSSFLKSTIRASDGLLRWNTDQHNQIQEYEEKSKTFEKTKAEKIQAIQLRVERWDADNLAKIKTAEQKQENILKKLRAPEAIQICIDNTIKLGLCDMCKQPLKEQQERIELFKEMLRENERHLDQYDAQDQALKEAKKAANPHIGALEQDKLEENTYSDRIRVEKQRVNPFTAQMIQLEQDTKEAYKEKEQLEYDIAKLEARISDLTQLYDLSFELRGEMLKQAVQTIQDSTNRYLEKYFDSEIRVGFALEGSDDLTITIQKSGYECHYKQLSRGQRALLKLAFTVSVMKAAANKAGTHFENLFFDEVLDGLDGELKIKAFSLLEELSTEHSSVMIIDHDQGLQNLFSKRFHVTMESDVSQIEELNE